MISFINTFLSYIMLSVIIVAVAGTAMAIGLTLAKKKNAKSAQTVSSEEHRENHTS